MSSLLSKIKRKTEYILNKRVAYDYEPQRGGWVKCKSPVFGDDSTASVFDPCVIQLKQGYRLFVSERNNNGIICSDSLDGVNWNQWKVSLKHGEIYSWEERVNRAYICKQGDKWLMWYTGQSKENSAIGLAVSNDGTYFERVSAEPVLVPEQPYEKSSVMNPCVLWDNEEKIFKMWYAAGEQFEPDVLCFATSTDGINWDKYKNNPVFKQSENKYDQCKVGGCDILKVNGKYYMFYIGYQNVDTARICVAESKNGVNCWLRYKGNPIISPEKGSWDSDAVYKPAVVLNRKENKLMLWFNGRKKKCERIGYAERKYHESEKKDRIFSNVKME